MMDAAITPDGIMPERTQNYPGYDGLRGFLGLLEAEGELLRIKEEVDREHEISAIIKLAGPRAVLFERVRGFEIPVVGNVFGSRRKLEIALGCPWDNIVHRYLNCAERLIPPVVVDRGPVHERIATGDDVDLLSLPAPIINEKDAGYYLDAGIVIAKDPEFGLNLSEHRLLVKGPRKTGILIGDYTHLYSYMRRAWAQGRPLEVAVAIGCDPVLYVASQVMKAIDFNEYDIAGALKGRPIDLVRCRTVDIEVPAHAEIVLEGILRPGNFEPEGPFGEFTGYYTSGDAGALGPVSQPVIEYQAITTRNKPILQTLYLGKPPHECVYLSSISKTAELYRLVKEVVPQVRGVYFTPGGCGRYHAVASIVKRSDGDAKLALAAMLSSRIGVKYAVVVDDDIDIYNPHEVEWAIATRTQFDIDSVIIHNAPHVIDPSAAKHANRLITKVGLDATRPISGAVPEPCDVPKHVMERVARNWRKYCPDDDASH
jgi:2,5-furandicarboxylate decarboxylase 1